MASLPDIVARLRLDTTDLDAGIARATGLGSAVGSAVGNLAANGLSRGVSALAGFAGGSVDAFARVEDALGAAGVQFGDQLGTIEAFASGASSAFGISKGAALDAANQFGTLGKAAGLTGPDLAGFSTNLTGLAGDLASFKGTSTEQAIEAVGAALRGETEPIRAYGVLLDDATLRNEALSLGLIDNVKNALTPQQKALAAQSAILKQTGDAQGDYARTSDSTANVQKTLAAETENAQAALGQKLAPAVTALREGFLLLVQGSAGVIDFIGGLAERVQPVVSAFAEGLKPALDSIVPALQGFIAAIPTPVLEALGVVVGIVAAAIVVQTAATAAASLATAGWALVTGPFTATKTAEGVVIARGTVLRLAHNVATVASTAATVAATVASRAFAIGQAALNAVLLANPFVLVAALIAALVAGIVIAYRESETFRNIIDTVFTAIKTAVGNAVGAIITLFRGLLGVWLDVAGGIVSGAATALSWVPGVGDKLKVAEAAFGTLKTNILGTLDSAAQAAFGFGEKTGDNVAGGIGSKNAKVREHAARAGAEAQGGFETGASGARAAGAAVGDGFVAGIDSRRDAAIRAAARLSGAAVQATRKNLAVASPSKVFRKIGQQVGDGFVDGMQASVRAVGNAGQTLADAAVVQPSPLDALRPQSVAAASATPGGLASADAGALSLDAVLNELRTLTGEVRRQTDRTLMLGRTAPVGV